jgi:hypothetical protein
MTETQQTLTARTGSSFADRAVIGPSTANTAQPGSTQQSIADVAEYKRAFSAVADHFEHKIGVEPDISGSDVLRLCNVSEDPEASIRRGGAVPFTARAEARHSTVLPVTPQHNPPSEWDVAVVRSALALISAVCKRAEWLRVACAIKNALGEDEFVVFDQWSATVPEKYDAAEARKLWDSMEPFVSGGVTLATLFRMAELRGWKDPKPSPSSLAAVATTSAAARCEDHYQELCGTNTMEPSNLSLHLSLMLTKSAGTYGNSNGSLAGPQSERRKRHCPMGHRTIILKARGVRAFLDGCRTDARNNSEVL